MQRPRMQDRLSERFVKDDLGLWVPREGVARFGYSDGRWVEKYLEQVFRGAKDLSSSSEELEHHIKDWNTEYHLTRKRKDLLAGFEHPRDARVLEIGCGCGAITRILGERYASVVAAEGSYNRARLARLRTADLDHVDVVCSPYQALGLQGEFDIVFCIGVLEYAPTYVTASDPFATALESMKEMLKPSGALVLAIENKLGLKYFANSTEDHSGTFFEGIEGYPRMRNKFKTFGRVELEGLLRQYYEEIAFYYPFPDYKIPTALLTEEAMQSLPVGELLGSMVERDYAGLGHTFFDNRLAWPEVIANGLGRDLANSFLVVASNGAAKAPAMADRLGVLFNSERRAEFVSETSIRREGDSVRAVKVFTGLRDASAAHVDGRACNSEWIDRPSVALELFRNALTRHQTAAEQVAPVRSWWDYIGSRSARRGDGMLDGDLIDAVWHNCCRLDDGELFLFDRELVWKEPIPPTQLFIRAAFSWGMRYRKREMSIFGRGTLKGAISTLAQAAGVALTEDDFRGFVDREATLQSEVGLISRERAARAITLQLRVPRYDELQAAHRWTSRHGGRAKNLLRRLAGK
jgi:2-polyprenyl-3-methyl-5-hydroxy-6-metoxy-1,4-benzoquinol methylase